MWMLTSALGFGLEVDPSRTAPLVPVETSRDLWFRLSGDGPDGIWWESTLASPSDTEWTFSATRAWGRRMAQPRLFTEAENPAGLEWGRSEEPWTLLQSAVLPPPLQWSSDKSVGETWDVPFTLASDSEGEAQVRGAHTFTFVGWLDGEEAVARLDVSTHVDVSFPKTEMREGRGAVLRGATHLFVSPEAGLVEATRDIRLTYVDHPRGRTTTAALRMTVDSPTVTSGD